MMLLRAFMAFFLWCGVMGVQAVPLSQPILDVHELSALMPLPNVRVIDIRDPKEYAAAHIPGALSAPYGQWRGPANNPGQLADESYLQQLVRSLGLTADQHVVVYSTGDSQTDFGAAARVYWTLKYVGLTHLSVLNGGYQQWQQASYAVNDQAVNPTTSTFNVQLNKDIVIFKDELLEKVKENDSSSQLIDARPEAFYEGKVKAPTATTPGTIAGAKNAQHQQWFNEKSATLKSSEQIKKQVQQQGLDQAKETVSFCNTGHWAATNWFVLSEIAGLKNVRLYPASLAEWTQSTEALPMAHTPSRAEQIRTKFQQLIKK